MRLSRRGALMLGAGWAAAGPLAAQGPAKAPERPFEVQALSWVRRSLHPIADENPPLDSLGDLVKALSAARVIGVGEATHGSHEDFAFKAALMKALIQQGGVRVLALECNFQAGLAFDRYVREGEGDALAPMYGSGFFSVWWTEEFADLITWIRGWNTGKERTPVRVVGVDCQATVRDTALALDTLAARAPAEAEAFRKDLAAIVGPEAAKARTREIVGRLDTAGLAELIAGLERLEARLRREADLANAAHAARTARQGLLMTELATSDAAKTPPPGYRSRRDAFMAANVQALAGEERAMLWAHNMHVIPIANDSDPGEGGTQGWNLQQLLGDGYRSVAFEYDHGRVHAIRGRPDGLPAPDAPWETFDQPSRAGGLGAFLATAGPEAFWLETRAAPQAWRAHPYLHDWPGFVIFPGRPLADRHRIALEAGVDILVFFRTVTASRLYPFLKQI